MSALSFQHEEVLAKTAVAWRNEIEELQNETEVIRGALREQHRAEMDMLNKRMWRQIPPSPKGTPGILNDRYILEHLLKQKDYRKAREVRDRMQAQEGLREKMEELKLERRLERHRSILTTKQNNELQALEAKLDLSVQLRRKTALNSLEKLIKTQKNAEKTLILRQNVKFSAYLSRQAKLLAKDRPEEEEMGPEARITRPTSLSGRPRKSSRSKSCGRRSHSIAITRSQFWESLSLKQTMQFAGPTYEGVQKPRQTQKAKTGVENQAPNSPKNQKKKSNKSQRVVSFAPELQSGMASLLWQSSLRPTDIENMQELPVQPSPTPRPKPDRLSKAVVSENPNFRQRVALRISARKKGN